MFTSAKIEDDFLFHSPLCIAAISGNLQLTKQLISEGENPLDRDRNNNTVLHFAAISGNLDILKYLIEDVGCNPAMVSDNEASHLLHIATQCMQLEVVKYLVEQCQLDPSELDMKKRIPLTMACYAGDLKIVSYLIEHMKDMKKEDIFYYEYEDSSSETHSPLCSACLGGHLPVVKYLIEECGCDPSRPESGHEFKTPLQLAVSGNSWNVVEYLVKFKEVIHSSSQFPASGNLVILAMENQNLDMLKCLIQSLGFNPNTNKWRGLTYIYKAAVIGNVNIIRYLMSLKCDPNIESVGGLLPIHAVTNLRAVKCLIEECFCNPSASTQSGVTLLIFAAAQGHLNIVKYLVEEVGCDLLQRDYMQNTALHSAAMTDKVPVLKYLIEDQGCDPYDANISGTNVLVSSAIHGSLLVVQYLIRERKMDKDSHYPILKRSILNMAASQGHLDVVSYLLEEGSRHLDQNLNTPLQWAAANGHLDLVKYLMTSYPGMYSSSPNTPPPLVLAAMKGDINILKFFIEDKNCDPSCRDAYGNTSLHYAAAASKFEMVKFLVSNSYVDPLSLNRFNQTALHLALQIRNKEISLYLIVEIYMKYYYN